MLSQIREEFELFQIKFVISKSEIRDNDFFQLVITDCKIRCSKFNSLKQIHEFVIRNSIFFG